MRWQEFNVVSYRFTLRERIRMAWRILRGNPIVVKLEVKPSDEFTVKDLRMTVDR